MDPFESRNPADGSLLARHPVDSPAAIASKLQKAREAFGAWRSTPLETRSRLLFASASTLERRREDVARRMTLEMGKPIEQSRGEVEKCAWVARYYAERGEALLAPTRVESDASESWIQFEPLGPILAVMPWNFPFWQVFRCAAPALMAGNVLLLKHASNVQGCSRDIASVFDDAGFPGGVFQSLAIPAEAVREVIADPRVAAATLTGSEAAGAKVAEAAGRVIKKTVLELGGSDAFVVLDDADVDLAATTGIRSRMINSGQSCIAAKRFIVHQRIRGEFLGRFSQALGKLRVGDPLDPGTDVGPLARPDLVADLHRQVLQSLRQGATLLAGGRRREGPGCFYEPTILTDVRPDMSAWHEETFGPVACVATARDEDEAIELANASAFGLGASLWTRDLSRARRLATRIDAGAVFINGLVKSDPRLPFGGIKRSGYGRELGELGLREFVNAKTVWLA